MLSEPILKSMKSIVSLLLAAGLAACLVQAQTAEVKPGSEAAVKSRALTPYQNAQYADLVRRELEAGVEQKLLTALVEDFRKRSTQPQPGSAAEKIRWQAELAHEFRERSSLATSRHNELTRKRLAFESDHGAIPNSAALLGALGPAKPLNPDELAYISRLDARALKLREELVQVEEANKALISQLQTNTTPEMVGGVSELLDSNTRIAKQLEWELGEFELRKLQFRALRK
jgi:hypothetical protein